MGGVTGDGRRRKQTRANASNLPVHGVATIFVGGIAIGVNAIRCATICRLVEGNRNQVVSYFRDHRAALQLLYLPGTVFVLVSLMAVGLHRMGGKTVLSAWVDSLKTTAKASVLVFTVPMVQVFLNSDGGVAGYDKMPIISRRDCQPSGRCESAVCLLVGGFGAFVAGSNTISNMMFSLFQFEVGIRIGVDATWMLALQAVGGAAGNVICVHKVVAALAVVGLTGRKGMLSENAARVCLLRVDGQGDRLRVVRLGLLAPG